MISSEYTNYYKQVRLKENMLFQSEGILERMTLTDIILGTLWLKAGERQFDPAALRYAVRKVAGEYPRLSALFLGSTDGSSPETVDDFDELFFFYNGVVFSRQTTMYERVMPRGRNFIERTFKKDYGNKGIKALDPLASRIWEEVETYTQKYVPALNRSA